MTCLKTLFLLYKTVISTEQSNDLHIKNAISNGIFIFTLIEFFRYYQTVLQKKVKNHF